MNATVCTGMSLPLLPSSQVKNTPFEQVAEPCRDAMLEVNGVFGQYWTPRARAMFIVAIYLP
jgi:hypothetical protein